jgi:predicted metal-dependent hydrolase
MSHNDDYQIRRSARVKRARIVVSVDKVEVVVPLSMPVKQVQQFVQAKQDWVASARSKVLARVTNIAGFAPDSYQQGVMIPFQGEAYPLQIKPTDNRQITIEFNLAFVANVPDSLSKKLSVIELSEQIRLALMTWMRAMAEQQVRKYTQKYQTLYQLQARSVRVKTQKSRWGSCGIHNDIYLNWLLILAPVAVFEYVVIHEICHLQHRNHSAEFWSLVAKHCPEYNKQRHWLRQYGASLMLGL